PAVRVASKCRADQGGNDDSDRSERRERASMRCVAAEVVLKERVPLRPAHEEPDGQEPGTADGERDHVRGQRTCRTSLALAWRWLGRWLSRLLSDGQYAFDGLDQPVGSRSPIEIRDLEAVAARQCSQVGG